MSRRIRLHFVPLALCAFALTGCLTSSHEVRPATLGTTKRTSELVAVLDQPGPIEVESVNSADWAVPLSGLVNLENPVAKDAGLTDHDEAIQVYFHVVRHPKFGTFVIDTGVERNLRDAPDKAAIRGFVTNFLDTSKMKIHEPLGDFLAKEPKPIAGILFTHLHLDHITGLQDAPKDTPLYAGPGETGERAFQNLVVAPNTNRALDGFGPLNEWAFQADADGTFDGVLDVFGDGSLWAISVPGHTPGSTAYLARTPSGPVLFTGDASHTIWGWEHDVEPGTFSGDPATSAKSFHKLRDFVKAHPEIEVHPGHQPMIAGVKTAAPAPSATPAADRATAASPTP